MIVSNIDSIPGREIAEVLGVALSTVKAEWAYAKGWIRTQMSG